MASTSTGVTGDTIKVVYYQTPDVDPVIDFITSEIKVDDTNADDAATLTGFNQMYSKFFETYGRKVDLQFYTGTGPSDDPVAARADAVTIANMQPFAVLGGPVLVPDFADELAARKVLCIGCTPAQGHQFYIDRQPYVWGVANSGEQAQTHSAEFVSKKLGRSQGRVRGRSGAAAGGSQVRTDLSLDQRVERSHHPSVRTGPQRLRRRSGEVALVRESRSICRRARRNTSRR